MLALRGEELCARPKGTGVPDRESIPPRRHRSTFGVAGDKPRLPPGPLFCSVALRDGKSVLLERMLGKVRTQAAEGADLALLVTGTSVPASAGPRFAANVPAMRSACARIRRCGAGIEYARARLTAP